MKNLSIFIIAVLLLFCVSCAEDEHELGGQTLADGIIIENTEMSKEDVDLLINVFNRGKFESDVGECISDVKLQIVGRVLTYHSECGTFNDAKNAEHFSLSEAERELVNATLSKYVELGERAQTRLVMNIIDTSKGIDMDFPDVMEPFFEDKMYRYSFGCPKSAYIVVKFSDGTSLPLRAALDSGEVEIAHLDRYEIPYFKEKIGTETKAEIE